MIKHSLVCLLQNEKDYGYKTLRLSSSPSEADLTRVYEYNILNFKKIIIYCQNNGIKATRVSSSLFPLSSHSLYREKALTIIDKSLKELDNFDYKGIELSMHPDQFILLSSLNPNVNLDSKYDLELTAHISKKLPIKLVNIHVGSKAQGEKVHREILNKNVHSLNSEIKKLLSFENDEKNYDFLTTLSIAQENSVMLVPDFHHERCYQRRACEYTKTNEEIDNVIYDNLEEVFKTYKGKKSLPTFHISSPLSGWCGKFKDECSHADYIDILDYPHKLYDYFKINNKEIILDIEAKHKQLAIKKLSEQLLNNYSLK